MINETFKKYIFFILFVLISYYIVPKKLVIWYLGLLILSVIILNANKFTRIMDYYNKEVEK